MINRITITGADNRTTVEDLVRLTTQFPAVEWAILVSSSQSGKSKRFPDIEHIAELVKGMSEDFFAGEHLSLHLCGQYVKEILMGDPSFIMFNLAPIWAYFNRVQINTHGFPHPYNAEKMVELMKMFPDKEFIFQVDNENTQVLTEAAAAGVNCSGLFDLSHGAGDLPAAWPEPFKYVKCGYAGGISPDNISDQIAKINSLVGSTTTWIDMETHVRTDDWLNLRKVEQCLSAHADYLQLEGGF